MTRLRPARTFRYIFSQAWARYSQKKPRKNYIRAKPHTSLLVFNMGVDKPDFDTVLTLTTKQAIQDTHRRAADKGPGSRRLP